jgi:hypothetical protein
LLLLQTAAADGARKLKRLKRSSEAAPADAAAADQVCAMLKHDIMYAW